MTTAVTGDGHVDHELGVFVLGVLSAPDEQAVADHLAVCPRCEAEARRLRDVRALLDRLGAASIARLPPPEVATPSSSPPSVRTGRGLRIWRSRPHTATPSADQASPHKRSARSRVVAAAVVVALAVGVGIGAWLGTRDPIDIRLAGAQEDAQTGLSMSVTVVATAGGSRIDASIRGLTEGYPYRLYAVEENGTSELAAAWTAQGPTEGIAGEVGIPLDRVTTVTLTRPDGNDPAGRILLTVRLSREPMN